MRRQEFQIRFTESVPIRTELSAVLETAGDNDKKQIDAFLVAANTIAQQGALFDVVRPTDRRSCCFTKAYGRYVEGTGSVLQTNPAPREGDLQDLRLRYLTPREIARLHCFPDDYSFPSGVSWSAWSIANASLRRDSEAAVEGAG